MKILALEFSSPQLSVAAAQFGATGVPIHLGEVIETGARSTAAFGLVEAALKEAALEREQIDCLAIGTGPGSYTGIRSAIALAQGWQLASDVKLLGISTVDCLAAQAQTEDIEGPVHIVIDAQRNEFYLATYELRPSGWSVTAPLRLATLPEVQQQKQTGGTIIGPEVLKWFPSGRLIFPRARALAQLASGRTDFVSGEKLEPIYLRETKFVKAPPPRILPT